MRATPVASLALLSLLFTMALAGPAAAGPRLSGVPAHVRAGEPLRISWSGLGPEAHETELELSLAGGRWVRISPELDAREGGFTWRVPAGLAGPARLRLKYGGEWFEAESELSVPFSIVAEAGAPLAPRRSDPLGEAWNLGEHGGGVASHLLGDRLALSTAAGTTAIASGTPRVGRPADATCISWRTIRLETDAVDPPALRAGAARRYPLRI